MKLSISEYTEPDDESIFQWNGSDKMFYLWFDNQECDWGFVTSNHKDPDIDNLELCGKLENEVLKKLYDRIGRILNVNN